LFVFFNISIIVTCQFINCSAYGLGGAIFQNNSRGTNFLIAHALFAGCVGKGLAANSSIYGGGAVYSSSSIQIAEAEFYHCNITNTSSGSGGGVYAVQNVDIRRVTFYNCSVKTYGGGLYVLGNVRIISSSFTYCNGSSGGGLYVGNTTNEFMLQDTELENNYADRGSGIYLVLGERTRREIRDCLFIENGLKSVSTVGNDIYDERAYFAPLSQNNTWDERNFVGTCSRSDSTNPSKFVSNTSVLSSLFNTSCTITVLLVSLLGSDSGNCGINPCSLISYAVSQIPPPSINGSRRFEVIIENGIFEEKNPTNLPTNITLIFDGDSPLNSNIRSSSASFTYIYSIGVNTNMTFKNLGFYLTNTTSADAFMIKINGSGSQVIFYMVSVRMFFDRGANETGRPFVNSSFLYIVSSPLLAGSTVSQINFTDFAVREIHSLNSVIIYCESNQSSLSIRNSSFSNITLPLVENVSRLILGASLVNAVKAIITFSPLLVNNTQFFLCNSSSAGGAIFVGGSINITASFFILCLSSDYGFHFFLFYYILFVNVLF
jgi:hypothetical protein